MTQSTSLGEHLRMLEWTGRVPALDRSSDLAGPDTDNDQVRDDVQAWIAAQNYPETERRAVQQLARALQQTVVLADPKNTRVAGDNYLDRLTTTILAG